jgi:hypothetical protein
MSSSYVITHRDSRQSLVFDTHSPLPGSAAGYGKGGGESSRREPCEVEALFKGRCKVEAEAELEIELPTGLCAPCDVWSGAGCRGGRDYTRLLAGSDHDGVMTCTASWWARTSDCARCAQRGAW